MADAPELILRRALAVCLDEWGLATYEPTGAVPELGVKLDGEFPTSVEAFTLLSSPATTFSGRADALYRVQFYTRRPGSLLVVEQWATHLANQLNMTEYRPNVNGIAWAEEASRLYFDPDTQGRSAVACTYAFTGRRAPAGDPGNLPLFIPEDPVVDGGNP